MACGRSRPMEGFGGMIVLQQLTAAALLIAVTLGCQCAGVAIIVEWLRTVAMRGPQKGPMSRSAVLVMETTMAVIVLQGVVIMFWASCYRWLCFRSWESAFYFSATSYST